MTASRPLWQRLGLAMVSGALMAIPFLDANYYALTWFAFVPLLLALDGMGLLRAYALGLTAGLVFSMIAGYWITDFLVIANGYSPDLSLIAATAFWLACAQVTGLMAVALNGLRHLCRRWLPVHDFILFPLVLAVAYSSIPMLFPFHPAETQSRFLSAIQAIELTGIFGLDALIGLVNVMVYRAITHLRNQTASRLQPTMPWLLAGTLVVSWFGYGAVTTRLWDDKLAKWETVTIGMVQPNETPDLARPRLYPGYSLAYPPEMAMAQRLANAGASLIVWPETRYKGYFDETAVRAAYSQQLSEAGAHLLFQDTEQVSVTNQYNTAVMMRDDGVALSPYRKMKTMPFGESLPLDGDYPLLNRLTRALFGNFLTQVSPGTEHASFNLGRLNVVPLICYETLFPGFVARALAEQTPGTLLVGLSSNGWFGHTAEPYQHINLSILRAVENRVPFVHVLNNGPSVVVLPNGRRVFESAFGEAGGYLVEVPYLAH